MSQTHLDADYLAAGKILTANTHAVQPHFREKLNYSFNDSWKNMNKKEWMNSANVNQKRN